MQKIRLRTTMRINSFVQLLFSICLFLAALNFRNLYYYLVYAAFAILIIILKQSIRLNISTLYLLLLGIAFLTFDPKSQSSITNIIRPFTYVLAYTIGLCVLNNNDTLVQKERKIIRIILVLAGGALMHYVLNYLTNLDSLNRNTVDFWSKDILSATGQACLALMSVGIVAAVLFSDFPRTRKLAAVAVLVLILVYNLILAGRTLIFMMVLVLGVAFLYQSIEKRKMMLRNVIPWIILIAIVLIAYNRNVFHIKSVFEDSNFYYRFVTKESSVFDSARVSVKLLYLKNMLQYPFGGSNLRAVTHGYAHDIYLDTYDQAGFLALIAVLMYIVASVLRLRRLLRSEKISFNLKQMLLCVYFVMNVEFWIEPILQGVPWLFVSYCIIDGMTAQLLSSISGTAALEK